MRNLILTAAAFATLAAAPAFAGEPVYKLGNNDAYSIRTGDLDMGSAAGRATALARVERAAAKICDERGTGGEIKACRADIVAASLSGPAGISLRLAMTERDGTVQTADAR